jgi:hypothetical protein
MRTKAIALSIGGVLSFAGGFLGHDALEGRPPVRQPLRGATHPRWHVLCTKNASPPWNGTAGPVN